MNNVSTRMQKNFSIILASILKRPRTRLTFRGRRVAKFYKFQEFHRGVAAVASFAFLATGCLQTRTDLKEAEQKKAVQDQVVYLQKSAADQTAKFSDINNDLREMDGRIAALENKVNQVNTQLKDKQGGESQKNQDLEKRLSALQDEMAKIEGQMVVMAQEVQSLKSTGSPGGDGKNTFETGEDLFERKEWKKAILAYQRFRDQNPKSKKFVKATLRIGLSFQELGLHEEAKTFFEEVMNRFPQSDEAKVAKTKLAQGEEPHKKKKNK
ncbi:MAG: hypothetical protein C5B49_12025 [Bdellovibrio sp.]|nr:MAG: hypothetical protein C5B49_12025 [Bdellovibrio sp.]